MKALPPPSRSSNVNPDRSTISAKLPNPTSVPENSKDATSLRNIQSHKAGDPQTDNQSPHQPAKSKSAGLFSLAATAFDKTSSALANISESSGTTSSSSSANYPDRTVRQLSRRSSNNSTSSSTNLNYQPEGRRSSQSLLLQKDSPTAQPHGGLDPSEPIPRQVLSTSESKMHQTSSRLLRMTDDDRPFTKDFKDLFATLVVSLLPLSAHRVRLTKVEHTFLSEDAINNLGSLKFSQSNRMPDPKDPSRIVTTTTTTTFSMAKDMARAICQRFLDARFIESADGRYQQVYTAKGSVWQLTAKGATTLSRFCSRNGIQQKQIGELVGGQLTQLVILERDSQTDKLVTDRGTVEVVFRRFLGTGGLNIKPTANAADSDSLHDYRDGLTGVKMASERKVNGKVFKDTFTGKATCDWLMDCCMTVDRRETLELATLFVQYDLIETIQQDRAYMAQYPTHTHFQPTKHAIYQLSAKGREVLNGTSARGRSSEGDVSTSSRNAIARDSNTQRLDKILSDPALRLLFRENLRETHCEENLSFYIDVDEFVQSCRQVVRSAQKGSATTSMDGVKEIMAQAYGIYNAFLAPGSPCELNIDHQLRNSLATRMTKAVGQDKAMIDTLKEVTNLFEEAQTAVFKLMASDSVPKFLRSPKYEQTLKHYDFDTLGSGKGAVDRSLSRSKRSG